MEPPVSSSRGPMSSLLGKLDSILECQQLLRNPVRGDFELLKEDLAGIYTFLLEISDEDDPNLVKKYWMKEVREICYDAEDYIDWLIHSAEAKIGSVGVVHRLKICQLPSRTLTPRPRLKITRLPRTLIPRPRIANQIKELRARLENAGERHKRYVLDNNTFYSHSHSSSSPVHSHSHWIPEWYREAVSILVGIDDSKKKLINLLNNGEKKLNVISVCGFGGIGKTTLVKQIFQELGGQFGCRAFVRVSRKPDTRSLLRSILSQTGCRNHSEACSILQLTDYLREHLQQRRYLIVMDDLWDTTVWEFLIRAFSDGTHSSRIITTTTAENVAMTCCGNRSDYILKMEPLNDNESRKLFFARVFGSENKFPEQFKDASYEIVRKCGGVPLAVIHIAGHLAHQQDKSEWDYVERSLGSNLSISPTYEGMRKVINLTYNGLPKCLKTCLQYVSMYPEHCTIWKDDLVRRWVAEGFIEGDSEVIAQSHFEELVYRGMIHPTDIDYNEQVLSCTVHHMILDFVRNKSAEDNFVTTVDYSQNTRELSSKVRRLFLFYSTAKYAAKLSGIALLQVRSLAFYGLVKCLPSIQEFKFLRVLVLHLWGDCNDSTILNLSGINRLFQLRYLKVTCNYCLQLPTHMGGLHRLETLEINAIVSTVPEDIVHLKYLVHLSLPQETKLPYEVGRLRSLRTLKCFDFCGNSDAEVKSLQELSCLEELQLVLTTAPSDSVDRNLKVLFSILGCLYELKSLVIVRGASVSKDSIIIIDSSSTSCPNDCLERLELHRGTCILRSLPKWIGQLGSLCILKLGVLEILKNDVDSFAGLQVLKFLSLYVRRPTFEPIIISSGAFPALERFNFKRGVLCIAFRPGAMPKLHSLKLSFNAYSGVEFGGNMLVGIEHLLNLQEVSGRIGAAVGSKESDKRTAESILKDAISKHSLIPRLNIHVVDWIEEDRVPAGDIMPLKTQINTLSGDHGFFGEKSEVNTNKVDECRTSSLFLDAVVTSSDVLNSGDQKKKSYVDVSKSTSRKLSTTTDIMSYFYGKVPPIQPLDSQLALDDLDVIKVICKRSSGNLQLVRHKFTGQFFVLKGIEINVDESLGMQIANELKLSLSLQCQYIVGFYQCFYFDGTISIVLEYMDGGSLADFLKTVKTIPVVFLAAICKKILKGLIYLHEKNIIHRDLKPSNILINHRGEVKVSDFGVSAIISSSSGQRDTFVGTCYYMSPERINGQKYGFMSDIWSLGLLLLECATGNFPSVPYGNFFELLEAIVDQTPPDQFSSEFCSFISACIQMDANDRSTAQILLEHPFLSMYDDQHIDLASYFTSAGLPHFYEFKWRAVTPNFNDKIGCKILCASRDQSHT